MNAPHLRPGTAAFDLHRIAALLTAALRDVAAGRSERAS